MRVQQVVRLVPADFAFQDRVVQLGDEAVVLALVQFQGLVGVVKGLGALAARKFPIAYGSGHEGGTQIFVSRGIGTVYVPVRINCPPEVALVTLASVPRQSPPAPA